MMLIVIGIIVVALVGVGIFFAIKGGTGKAEDKTTVELNKEEYEQGEKISVTYSIVEEIEDSAWIGIVPSDTPHGDEEDGDAADVSYEYLEGDKSGSITLYAPYELGEYDVRIYSADSSTAGEELGYATFTVVASEEALENDLVIFKTSFEPGEEILVSYTTDGTLDEFAWIGIVPSDVPHGDEGTNDEYDIEYRFLDEVSGTLTFTAPDEIGEYDLRMHDGDWEGANEIAYVSFTVESR